MKYFLPLHLFLNIIKIRWNSLNWNLRIDTMLIWQVSAAKKPFFLPLSPASGSCLWRFVAIRFFFSFRSFLRVCVFLALLLQAWEKRKVLFCVRCRRKWRFDIAFTSFAVEKQFFADWKIPSASLTIRQPVDALRCHLHLFCFFHLFKIPHLCLDLIRPWGFFWITIRNFLICC